MEIGQVPAAGAAHAGRGARSEGSDTSSPVCPVFRVRWLWVLSPVWFAFFGSLPGLVLSRWVPASQACNERATEAEQQCRVKAEKEATECKLPRGKKDPRYLDPNVRSSNLEG